MTALRKKSNSRSLVSRLPESFKRDDLKNYIEKYTLGSVLDLRIERSKTGRMKATCAIHTDISKATVSKLLRESTFHGHRLDVEMVYSAMSAARETTKCARSDPLSSGAHGLDREIVLFLSKLPNVNAALLKQHIRSHTGGRVIEVETGPSTRGGMKALCVVKTHLDLKQALGRLQRARFQGRQVHVQILSRVAQGETLPSPQQLFSQHRMPSVAEAAPLEDKLHFRSMSHFGRLPYVAETPEEVLDHRELTPFPVPAAKQRRERRPNRGAGILQARNSLDQKHSISTSFLRYVMSEPERVRLSENADDLDDLFMRFCMDTIATTRMRRRLPPEDDDSQAWLHEPPVLSNSSETPVSIPVHENTAPANAETKNKAALQADFQGAQISKTKAVIPRDDVVTEEKSQEEIETTDLQADVASALRSMEDGIANEAKPQEANETIAVASVTDRLSLSNLEGEIGISGMCFVDVDRIMATDDWSMVSDCSDF